MPEELHKKVQAEVSASRIKGPYHDSLFPNVHISPIDIVPKKTTGHFRVIQHLTYPEDKSINDFSAPKLATVTFASFDDAASLLRSLGKGTFMAKPDRDNAL